MNRKIIICAITLIACLSCSQEVKQQPYIVIDMENSINNGPIKMTLNDITENIRIIPTETTDSTLFSNIGIEGITKENIIVLNRNLSNRETFLYFINKETGKVSVLLNKQGNGPGEYLSIDNAVVKEQDSIVYVSDMRTQRIYTYNFHGDFINSVKNDSMVTFNILNDGNFVVGFSTFFKLGYALGIYDKSWNLKRKGIPVVYNKTAMVHVGAFQKFNNEYYYRVPLEDTLYHVTSEYEKPYLVHSKGKYKLPPSVYASLAELDKNGYQYIQQDGGIIISKYYFLSYIYNQAYYYDIWDLETSTMIYRNKYTQSDAIAGLSGGIPISIGDVQINIWPRYVDGDMIYCVIEVDDALKLVPSLPSDTNPIILELKIKK